MSDNPIDRRLSADETDLVDMTRRFCAGAFSDELFQSYREGRPFSRDWIRAWAQTGMLGLQAKMEHGGIGASYLCKIRVAQEMAAHGFAAAFCLNHHQGCVTRLSQTGTPEQIERLLRPALVGESLISIAMSEIGGGSDAPAMSTLAVPVDGGWRLKGAKAWVTNGLLVDTLILLAKVDGVDGDPIASFFVPLGDAQTVSRREITMPGARSFRLAEIALDDHFVPHWALIAPPGKALKAAMGGINGARVHVAAMSVAALRSSLAWAVDYGARRRSFGSALVEHQGWRWGLAEVSAGLEAAEALVFVAADAIERGGNPVALAAQCKAFAVETAVAGLDRLMRSAGAIGASDACRLPMQHAETRLAAYADGTREMLLDRIGRSLGRTYPLSPAR